MTTKAQKRLVDLPENPMVLLLDTLSQKDGRANRPAVGAWCAAGFAFAVFFLAWPLFVQGAFHKGLIPVFLGALRTAGIVYLGVFAFLQAYTDAALLASLRTGRTLEEILTTPTSALELVDGIALHSVREALLPGLGLWLVLVVGELSAGITGWMLIAAAWFPLLIVLTGSFAYLLANFAVGVPGREANGAELLGLAAVVLGCFAAVSGLCPWWVLGMALWAWFNWACRSSAALALASLPQEDAEPRRLVQTSPSNPWIRPWDDNPVVVRECAREARKVSGGAVEYIVNRFGVGLSVAVVVGWLGLPVLALALAAVQSIRAAHYVLSAVVAEREKRTLEPLALTCLSAEDFVDGWTRLGFLPRLVEYGVTVGLWTGWLLFMGVKVDLVTGIPLVFVGAALIVVSSYRGLVAAMERSRRSAVVSTGVFFLLLFGLVTAGTAVEFGHPALWALALGLFLAVLRGVAVKLATERIKV